MNQTAEALILTESQLRPHLELVPPLPPEEARRFISADDIPELAEARRAEYLHAEELLAANRKLFFDGRFDQIRPVVDALGTARLVVEAEREFGAESPEREESFEGLVLDCERLFAEAERKLTWEDFGETRQEYDPATEDFYSQGRPHMELIDNGISPIAEPEELDRRINEKVEEGGTYRAIGRIIMPKNVEIKPVANEVHVITTSQCTDAAIESYKKNPKGAHGGYVPEIEKIMFRDVRFDRTQLCRYERQIGVSGKYITNTIINRAYQVIEVSARGSHLSKTEIHATQVVTEGEFDLLEIIELCDILASEEHGMEIFMGEPLEEGQEKDYTRVPTIAAERRGAQKDRSVELARYLVDLEKHGVDHWLAEKLVEDYVKERLLDVAYQEPEKAAIMFDEPTAHGFRAAQRLNELGHYEMAEQIRIQTEQNAPAPAFCGADSCGLREASEVMKKELKEALDIKYGDKVIEDLIRKCRCGQRAIVYAYTEKKVNKFCTSCKAVERKATSTAK